MHTYTCITTVINRGTVCICFQKLGPQNMQDAMRFAMQSFVWFWLAALHGTSTNRMCYLSYQRACHYNAYPAQNGWQSLEQDTNTRLNMFTNGTTFIKVKTKINYGSISPKFEVICTESNTGQIILHILVQIWFRYNLCLLGEILPCIISAVTMCPL